MSLEWKAFWITAGILAGIGITWLLIDRYPAAVLCVVGVVAFSAWLYSTVVSTLKDLQPPRKTLISPRDAKGREDRNNPAGGLHG